MEPRTLDLETLVLQSGGHGSPEEGMCVMEAVAFVNGEPFSDRPKCACRVLGNFLRNWNDSLDDATRQRLKPYIPRIAGTANDGQQLTRSWMCMDWLTRECAAAFLELTPALKPHAESLRVLPEIKDQPSLDAAIPTIQAARAAAWDAAWAAAGDAAWDAAWDAAGDAARAAAGAAAGDAAWDAARDAAGDAAWAAAWAAAGAAARDAAGAALQPTVARLQESAFALLERMLALPDQAVGAE